MDTYIERVGINVHFAGPAYNTKPYQTTRLKLNYYYIRFQVEGSSITYLNDNTIKNEPGDFLVCIPGDTVLTRFDYPPDSQDKMFSSNYYIGCSGPWLDTWWNARRREQKMNLPLNENYLAIFKLISMEQRHVKEPGLRASAQLLQVLFAYIDREIHLANSASEISANRQSFLARRMKQYIEEHATTFFQLENVADHVGLSVSRTAHLFKECFGQTIMQYTLEIRLKLAYAQVQTSARPLGEIAQVCGFGSYSYFQRSFLNRFGVSPRDCRNSLSESGM